MDPGAQNCRTAARVRRERGRAGAPPAFRHRGAGQHSETVAMSGGRLSGTWAAVTRRGVALQPLKMPPPEASALLPVMVLRSFRTTTRLLKMPPPRWTVVLPAMVLL